MIVRIRKPKVGKPSPLLSEIMQQRIDRARMLDRIADAELQQGHHGRAEYLAWQACQLREGERA